MKAGETLKISIYEALKEMEFGLLKSNLKCQAEHIKPFVYQKNNL